MATDLGVDLGTITLGKHLTEGDVVVTVETTGDLPLVDLLGMLDLAKDTLIREAMADEPDDEDGT